MELLLLVFFCLLTGSEVTFGAENGTTVVRVNEGSDVTLPCSLREDITKKKFEWKKDGRQVFLYDAGDHSNFVPTGQDQLFKGRVEHFPDKLKSGDASITIIDIKVFDSGVYTCEFPDLQPRQIFYIQLFVGTTVVRVEKGSDVILPCSLREDITNKKFEWKIDGRQVFLYDDGDHSNNAGTGQDQQFKDRVSHFPDKLKSGDASITIRDMMVAETGLYTCEFPDLQPIQIFYIKLIVYVEAKPSVMTLEQRGKSAVLQCEVQGAFPKPKLHWEDGAGNKLPAEEPQESERGGLHYDVILQTTVTKTDNYRCVVTQEEINYHTYAETYVSVPVLTGWEIAGIVIGAVALVVVGGLAVYRRRVRIMSVFMSVEAPKPSVMTLEQSSKSAVLQCEVRGAFPKPELHWEDGAGNKLPAEEPEVRKRGLLYDVILQTTVTKTDYYRCVAKQKEINHQTDAYIEVRFTAITFIRVDEGSDVILPCLLRQDITNKKFVWKKNDQVVLYDDGTVNDNNSQTHHVHFIQRFRHLPNQLNAGNASLIIRSTKAADSGNYTCEFPEQSEQTFLIQLYVEPKVFRVKEGSVATLPCSLYPEDITEKKFEWKKDGRQVFLYDNGTDNSQTQHDHFKDRVNHFPKQLKLGQATITISNMKVDDSGVYTCEFPDLQPEQTFYVRLVVFEPAAPTAPTAPGKGPAQDPKKTEPAAPTAPGNRSAQDPKKTEPAAPTASGKGSAQDPKKTAPNPCDDEAAGLLTEKTAPTAVTAPGNRSAQDPKKTETTVIREYEGSNVTLPCSLKSGQDITSEKFEWKKDGEQLFLRDKGQHIKDRFSLVPAKLKSGDASITIRDMKVTDSGLYTCEFPEQPEQIFHIKLDVGPTVTVKAGRDVTLPCSLNTEDITNKKFVWKKGGHQMFRYEKGEHHQFNNRISCSDKLKSGDASITIRDTKVTDRGGYTCEFPDQSRKIFDIQLVVEPADPTAPGKGSAQDRKKTDGDVEAGLPLMTANTSL